MCVDGRLGFCKSGHIWFICVNDCTQNIITLCLHIMQSTAILTVQLNLNFTHACRYTLVLACLTRANLQKQACALTVACDFGMCMWDSKHT